MAQPHDPTGTPRPSLKVKAAERPNTLGLGQRELELMLTKIEALDAKNKTPVRREFSRWPYRQATIRVTLVQPSGGEVHLKLACRNLSRGGVSLLHNQFIHPASTAVVSLPRLAGGYSTVSGVVKRCVHKRLTLHEIGIEFDGPIDLREFFGSGRGTEFYSLEHVDPEKLEGQLLYVEDSDIDFRVFQHFLRETSLAVTRAKNATEAIGLCDKFYDIIICDWRLPDMSGTDFVRRLRESAIETPVLLITADPVSLMKSGIQDITNTSLLTKPLTQQLLLRAIAERLIVQANEATDDSNSDQPRLSPSQHVRIPEGYVEHFLKLADVIDQKAENADAKGLSEICMQIRGSAPNVGASHLAKLADQTAGLLNESASVTQGIRMARELSLACRRLMAA